MIRFEQVSKAYLGGRQALQGVDFHLRPAEMAFLTGHSGAGKSTLLKLICGIERPSAGHIWFGGHDISRLKNRKIPSDNASSRLPVGSSASNTAGLFTTARAIPTRCCSPPES